MDSPLGTVECDHAECDHEYIEDWVDLDPDRSQYIVYCRFCEAPLHSTPKIEISGYISSPRTIPMSTELRSPQPRRTSYFESCFGGFSSHSSPSPLLRGITPPPTPPNIPPGPPVPRPRSTDVHSHTSSISYEKVAECPPSPDIQSILVEEDLRSLEGITMTDTQAFVPNVQYGKVLKILSSTEFILGARIYNGYTKVLGPTLYHFHVRLREVPMAGVFEERASRELELLILNKVVVLRQTRMSMDQCIEADVYYRQPPLWGTSDTGNDMVYVNECMTRYLRIVHQHMLP